MSTPRTTDHPRDARPHDDGAVVEALVTWAPHQRWYPAKGDERRPEPIAVVDLEDPRGEAVVELHLLRLPSGGVLQVPVVLRGPGSASSAATIASVPDHPRVGGPADLVDGCHDPAFLRAWVAAAEWADGRLGDVGTEGAKVLGGEQSNTSVLLPACDPPAILKVFRGVSGGPNPDVEVPLALSRVWDGVPRPLAWLTARWPGGLGHLGVLSELVVGAQDGFELACEHARTGRSFAGPAEDLGRTTAAMHRALRTALPLEDGGRAGDDQARHVVATLRRRAAEAVAAAPVLSERAARVDAVLATVEDLQDLPPLQRVHGDYHLGQVLRSTDRGWAVLDFEGEPQASREERERPDLALRDLAGMLRSVDYAAAVGGADGGWATEARDALVTGYQAEAAGGARPDAATRTVLRALELDKALYEVVYETRNRPDWLGIPLAGVDRLLADDD